jgi:hypothetical protein
MVVLDWFQIGTRKSRKTSTWCEEDINAGRAPGLFVLHLLSKLLLKPSIWDLADIELDARET